MKKRKFPQDVARFFHPEKSINPNSSGIHQIEKTSQRSYIPVYNGMGTARCIYDEFGLKSYSKFLGQDIPEQERWQFLQDNADSVEKIGYTHRFTPEELAQKKETLAEVSITINDVEMEKKEAMESFKERLKPLNEEKQELLDHIKRGSEYVENEECAKILYHEEKMAGFYNKLGELVYSRPIMPQEMQKTVFSINRKTGTDN